MADTTKKIIRGVVNSRGFTITSPITQWDYGWQFVPEIEDLPPTYRLDFSNEEKQGTALPVYCSTEGAEIPTELIDTGKDVWVWFVRIGEGYGITEYKWRVPNKCKPKTEQDEPTPSQQSSIDQAISVVNEAVEQAQDAQEAIENMSVSAQTLAEGSSATVTKSEEGGVVHLEFGIPKGATGDTPTITASKTGKTTSIYVDGSEVAQIEDGTDGIDGDDGYSPTASVSKTGKTTTITITDKDGTTSAQVSDGEDGTDYVLTEEDKEEIADMVEVPSDWLKAFPTDTASGAVASFTDGADGLPLKSLVVNIEPKQDGTGDPSPDNVRPINGWTGMGIQHDGKNLLDPTLLKDQVAWNIIRIYAPVGTVLTMSTNQPGASTSGLLTYFRTPGGAQGANENLLDAHPVTKTVGEEGYLEIVQRNRDNIKSYADYEYQIEVGSTATSYEPYKGRTIPISWQSKAGTVYGGKLDALRGILTVYPYYASYNGETLTGRWISDRDVYAVGTTPTIGAQVVNIGAVGTEIQLEPHEVASLLGVNNIFADTGNTEVEYRANTKLYIEKLTQPEEDDMIADSAITSGQFFMVGNSLYRALANIASGATITVGTNAQRVSLSDALNLVNA